MEPLAPKTSIQIIDPRQKLWEPHKKQVEFIEIPDTVFEALYGGAAGGGKSEVLLMLPVVRQWIDNAKFKGIIFRRTFPQLEASLIPRSREFYTPLGATYNESKHIWTFPSGAVIHLSHMEKDKHAREHDTNEWNYVGFDELTHFNPFQYLFLTSRVRSSEFGLPKVVRAATNPGNVGHVWVRDRFVMPSPHGGVLLFDKKSKSYRIFIQARLTDNPYLMKSDPDYINRLQLLPEAERRAKLDGDWFVFAGQVFSEFRLEPLSDEPNHAQHVIPYFEPPFWWPRIISCDWGYAAKTWVGMAAIAPDGRAFVYREFVAQKREIEDWGADVRRLIQFEKDNIASAVLDPSAWQKRGTKKTLAEQIADATGLNWSQADNDRLGGKLNYHEMLRWKPRPPRYVPAEGYQEEVAQRILRMRGADAYTEYLKLFQPDEPELNLPRLQIMDSCPELIKTIPLCLYEEKEGKVCEDVAEFVGDDSYDGSRYLLKEVDRYVRESAKRDKARTKIANIYEKLAKTGDQTAFHRELEKHEAESPKVVGIHRGRRRGVHFVPSSFRRRG